MLYLGSWTWRTSRHPDSNLGIVAGTCEGGRSRTAGGRGGTTAAASQDTARDKNARLEVEEVEEEEVPRGRPATGLRKIAPSSTRGKAPRSADGRWIWEDSVSGCRRPWFMYPETSGDRMQDANTENGE